MVVDQRKCLLRYNVKIANPRRKEYCIRSLRPGDEVANVYPVSTTPLLRTIVRANCPECENGYADLLITDSSEMETRGRYEGRVERILGVHDGCDNERE